MWILISRLLVASNEESQNGHRLVGRAPVHICELLDRRRLPLDRPCRCGHGALLASLQAQHRALVPAAGPLCTHCPLGMEPTLPFVC